MLQAWRVQRMRGAAFSAAEAEVAAPPLAPQDVPNVDAVEERDALLRQWMSLAGVQQRIIHTLVAEIQRTSGLVETEADQLSGRFQRLALGANEQSSRVDQLSALAIGIEVDGRTVPIVEIARVLETTLGDVVQKILMLSKDSMAMVYALDDLNANVNRVEACMENLRKINSTANFLALNARIESERSGSAGATFRVVASEMRELSKATQDLTNSMQTELKSVTDGIAVGHETLKRVATIDMSENIMARDRLEVLLGALVARSERLGEIVGDAAKGAEAMSVDVGAMVTGLQFQDRTRQNLEHVVDALQVVDRALEQIKSDTSMVTPQLPGEQVDHQWVKNLVDGFTMSEMRVRFIEQVLEGKRADDVEVLKDQAGPAESGAIELF